MKECGKLSDESGPAREAARRGRKDYGRGTGLAPEQARMKQNIHIAWDLPQLDLRDRLKEMVKHVKPYKITCYVLIGFNSTIEQDLFRLNVLRELGITPFVIPFRDYGNERTPTRYERDLARWANRMWLFKSSSFENYMPRKGFKCGEYLK